MKTDNNRKYLLIFSGVLFCYQYLGLVIDKNIPFTQLKITSQQNILIILTVLIVFFGIQYIYSWLNQKKEDRNYFEFASSIPISLIVIAPVCYDNFKKIEVDWLVITSATIILVFGMVLATVIDFLITIPFSMRTSEEMKKMGLGKFPPVSKALIRSLFFTIPLSFSFLLLLITYEHLLPLPINNYWLAIYLVPALIINLENFLNLSLCLGSAKVRNNALERLRIFRKAMSLHEMHYQHIGIEKNKSIELPLICAASKNDKLPEIQKLLSIGIDPNTQDNRGWSSLMWASAEGHQKIVEVLLEHGADPNIINYLGRSAIMYASNYGFYDIVKSLLHSGAITTPSSEFRDNPALSAAVDKGHLEVVKILVEHGANVLHKNKDNKTALNIAMEAGYGDIAKYLRNIMLKLDSTPHKDKTNVIKNIDWLS